MIFRWRYVLPALAIIVISIIPYVPPFIFLGDLVRYVFLVPFLEESVKIAFALKYRTKSFSLILLFGICELCFIKIPVIIYANSAIEAGLLILVSLIAFNFHVSTAFAYSRPRFSQVMFFVFLFCISTHALFNYMTFLSFSWKYLVLSTLISVLPLLSLTLDSYFQNCGGAALIARLRRRS